MARELNRRTFLGRTTGASVVATLALSHEEKALLAQAQKSESATKPATPARNTEGLPCGKIGNVAIGRLILGGNLIGGAAHSRMFRGGSISRSSSSGSWR